jgi:hypothetical protein
MALNRGLIAARAELVARIDVNDEAKLEGSNGSWRR